MLEKYLLKEIPLCNGVCLLGAMRYDHRDSDRQDYGKGLFFRSNDSSVLFRLNKTDSISFIKNVQSMLDFKSGLTGFSFSHGISLKHGNLLLSVPHIDGRYNESTQNVELLIKQGIYAFSVTLPTHAPDFTEYLKAVMDNLSVVATPNNVVPMTPSQNKHTLLK